MNRIAASRIRSHTRRSARPASRLRYAPWSFRRTRRCGDNAGIRRSRDKYRWDLLEEDILLGFCRNPYAYYVLDLILYSPYPGWGDEYPNECWMNEKGERAYYLWGEHRGLHRRPREGE